jgi:glyoxylase-like metal-dependent hydrolase (beta-lactamase superfamily II)
LQWGDILHLGKLDKELHDIHLIRGRGLTSNIYLIDNDLLIDTGNGEPINRITPVLTKIGVNIKNVQTVVLTHSHYDHIGGLTELTSKAHPTIMIHPYEQSELHTITTLTPVSINEGDTVKGGDYLFQVLHTPGHTSGSICLYEANKLILISGDTIFSYGGFGRTDLPTGNTKDLIQSIRRISQLQVHHLLPGHEDPIIKDASTHVTSALKNSLSFQLY